MATMFENRATANSQGRKIITKAYVGSSDSYEISDQFCDKINNARDFLVNILMIEEKFDIVLENYNEYEVELLSIASSYNVFPNNVQSSLQNARILLNRRIINLLATGSMYSNQLFGYVKRYFGKDSLINHDLLHHHNSIINNNQGYKFGIFLRNYTLHFDAPVDSISYSLKNTSTSDEPMIGCIVKPKIKKDKLIKDRKFKTSLVSDEKIFGLEKDHIDLRLPIRYYMEGLNSLHSYFRLITKTTVDKSDSAFNEIFEIVKENFENNSLDGIVVLREDENQSYSEICWIVPEVIERRKKLESKNLANNGIQRTYASNII